MKKTKLFILGASDQAKVVFHALPKGYELQGFIDIFNNPDFPSIDYRGYTLAGDLDDLRKVVHQEGYAAIVAFGDNHYRRKIFEEFKEDMNMVNIIHPSAIYQKDLEIGSGNYIGPGAIINNDVKVGSNNIINTGVILEHDCIVKDHVHLAPGSVVSGNVVIEEEVFIGAGAILIDDIHIGAGAVIGAGATVIDNIPANTLAVGTPAKVIKNLL